MRGDLVVAEDPPPAIAVFRAFASRAPKALRSSNP